MASSPLIRDEVSSPIVDCDLLEAAKENVQPLAMGRRVTALSTILATPHAQREAKISSTRNKLRINVELAKDDEDGDPLDAYCQLVYWTVENYPQGHSAESGLMELLEEATRELKDDREGKWRKDIKYLKLWLLYASYVEKPTIIYKFLIANEIGTDHALLYEEHAAVLERDGRRREADGAYSLGIARKAHPLDHLQSRYEDFQKRMMSNMTLPPAQATVPSSRPARQALAMTSSGAATTPAQAPRSTSMRPTPSSSNTRATTTPQSNSRLQIFVDPTGESAQATDLAGASANEWNELDSRKARVKENVPEVRKMVGSTIKQPGKSKRLAAAAAGAAASSSTSKISIFRDPPPGEASPVSSSKSPSSSASKSFAPFVDAPQEDAEKGTQGSLDGSSSPAFTPFRDEDYTTSPVISGPSTSDSTTLQAKKVDLKAAESTSEAEALRRDPLKNYPAGIRGIDSST
ncbi:other/BUB protein kinase [Crepidotus variabilis]|uniref:Other/BUB protein kinase n=1 Tax=Crepidotus variabilis TaxID=179855 RepID=A0A9P6EJG5_9AGAR|nr:other/BUB protein kinase [Crepidotus variabilis]